MACPQIGTGTAGDLSCRSPIDSFEVRNALEVAITGHKGKAVGEGCGGDLAISQGGAVACVLQGGSQDSGALLGLGVKGKDVDVVQKSFHGSGEFCRSPSSSSVMKFHDGDGADGHFGGFGLLKALHHRPHAAQVVADRTGIQEELHANGSLAGSFLPGRSRGSSQVPALARKASDHLSTTGSMTMDFPSQRSRTRVPRGSRQSPINRTARLLPTLKTTVSPFTIRRISLMDILSRVEKAHRPARNSGDPLWIPGMVSGRVRPAPV